MAINPNDFDFIRKLIKERSAIILEPGKEYLVESRMWPLVNQEGLKTIEELVQKLKTQLRGPFAQKVVDAMTTNETSFFRDLHPFEALKKVVIPEMIKLRAKEKTLSLWCGASSSGQEPYTILMLLRENFPELANWKFTFIASDLSTEMLTRCREGIYSQLEVNRGLPAMLLVKYFQRENMTWRVKPEFRKQIDFRQVNLAERWPIMPKMDIVMMRNVLIYFDVQTKKQILGNIRQLLKPDGYMFLGAAETTLNLDDKFVRVQFPQAGCYKIGT